MTDFDEAYGAVEDLFGRGPESLLKRYYERLPAGGVVLDIGVGQGRNALYLARHGLRVVGIDPSAVAVRELSAAAAREQLSVQVGCEGFERHEPPAQVDAYDGVLVFGLLPILTWPAIAELRERLGRWTRAGSLIWVTGFTTDDPAYESWARQGRMLGENSFEQPGGALRTFLRPGQLVALFVGHDVLHHEEGLGPWHQHGEAPPERHAVARVVLRRR